MMRQRHGIGVFYKCTIIVVLAAFACQNIAWPAPAGRSFRYRHLSPSSSTDEEELVDDWQIISISLLIANLEAARTSASAGELDTSQIKKSIQESLAGADERYLKLLRDIAEVFSEEDGSVYILYKTNGTKHIAVRVIDARKKDDIEPLSQREIAEKKVQFIAVSDFLRLKEGKKSTFSAADMARIRGIVAKIENLEVRKIVATIVDLEAESHEVKVSIPEGIEQYLRKNLPEDEADIIITLLSLTEGVGISIDIEDLRAEVTVHPHPALSEEAMCWIEGRIKDSLDKLLETQNYLITACSDREIMFSIDPKISELGRAEEALGDNRIHPLTLMSPVLLRYTFRHELQHIIGDRDEERVRKYDRVFFSQLPVEEQLELLWIMTHKNPNGIDVENEQGRDVYKSLEEKFAKRNKKLLGGRDPWPVIKDYGLHGIVPLDLEGIRGAYSAFTYGDSGGGKKLSTISKDPDFCKFLAQRIGHNNRGKKALSIGIGSGVLEEELKNRWNMDVTGIDPVKLLLKRAMKKGIDDGLLADGQNLPFRDESFDVVILPESIGHMDLNRVLGEAYRILKPGGTIHITTYTPPPSIIAEFKYRLDDPEEIISALGKSGFGYNRKAMLATDYVYFRGRKPPDAKSRGYSGLSDSLEHSPYRPIIQELIDKATEGGNPDLIKTIGFSEGRFIGVPLSHETKEGHPQIGTPGHFEVERRLPEDLKHLLLQAAEEGEFTILFIEGLDEKVRRYAIEKGLVPPEKAKEVYGSHYGIARNQIYLDARFLKAHTPDVEFSRHLRHELIERQKVVHDGKTSKEAHYEILAEDYPQDLIQRIEINHGIKLPVSHFIQLFEHIGRRHICGIWNKKPYDLMRWNLIGCLKYIDQMGVREGVFELRALELFREIGLHYIGPILEQDTIPSSVHGALLSICMIGVNRKTDELKIMEFFRKVGIHHIGPAWMDNPDSFAEALRTIHDLDPLEEPDKFRALEVVEVLVENELLKEHIGTAWRNNPISFAKALKAIDRIGIYNFPEIIDALRKEDWLREHLVPSWENDPCSFVEILESIYEMETEGIDLLRQLKAMGIKNLFCNALRNNAEGLNRALKGARRGVFKESFSGINWKEYMQKLDELLQRPRIRHILDRLPTEIKPVFRVEAFMMTHNDKSLDAIEGRLTERYEGILKDLEIYNKYLNTVGIEIEVPEKYAGIFPVTEAMFICSLLGINLSEDQTVPIEYSPLPLRHYNHFGQYFRLFSETGFIPGEDICPMHISVPYDKRDEERIKPGIEALTAVTGLLYSPDKRLGQGAFIAKVIRLHKDRSIIEPAEMMEKADSRLGGAKEMGRIEMRHFAFRKSGTDHLKALKAINLLYSCLGISLKDKFEDEREERLARIWREFITGYNEIMAPHIDGLNPWEEATTYLGRLRNIRNEHKEDVIDRLNSLVEKNLIEIEAILNYPPGLIQTIKGSGYSLLHYIQLFKSIGREHINKDYRENEIAFGQILTNIYRMGINTGTNKLRALELFEEIGMPHIRAIWQNAPAKFTVALIDIIELGIDDNTKELISLEVIRELKRNEVLEEYIGPAWQRDPIMFVKILLGIHEMDINQKTLHYRAMEFFEEIGMQYIGKSLQENPSSFVNALRVIQKMGINSETEKLVALEFLCRLKTEALLRGRIGPAWQNDPFSFAKVLENIYRWGSNENTGELKVLEFFRKMEVPGLIADAFEYSIKELSRVLESNIISFLSMLKNDALVPDWQKRLRELNELLKEEQLQSLLAQIPREIIPLLKVDAFIMLNEGMNKDDIAAKLLEKYRGILKSIKVYNKYLSSVGIEIEVPKKYKYDFPATVGMFICTLLGISLGHDESVPLEYAPLPVRYHGLFEPYYRLFSETGFIPGEDVCAMHVSVSYNKDDKDAVNPAVDLIANVISLLYSPEERYSQSHYIGAVIITHDDLVEISGREGEYRDGNGDRRTMGRIEIRSPAFKKGEKYHREAVRAINLLYSCFNAYLRREKAQEIDEVERRLADIWQEFDRGYSDLLSGHKTRFYPREMASGYLGGIHKLKGGHPDVINGLERLLKGALTDIEAVLEDAGGHALEEAANELGIEPGELEGLLAELDDIEKSEELKDAFLGLMKKDGQIERDMQILIGNIERVVRVIDKLSEHPKVKENKREEVKRISLYLSIIHIKNANTLGELPECIKEFKSKLMELAPGETNIDQVVNELMEMAEHTVDIGGNIVLIKADIYLRKILETFGNERLESAAELVRHYLYTRAEVARKLEVGPSDIDSITTATSIAKIVNRYLRERADKDKIVDILARHLIRDKSLDRYKDYTKVKKSIQKIADSKELSPVNPPAWLKLPSCDVSEEEVEELTRGLCSSA